MNYYIQHSELKKEKWITHQMAYDSRNKAMDVYDAVYRDDKYLDYRVVDERFVKVSLNGIVMTLEDMEDDD